ncbi:unnamed protein product, partial [Didymodactylos carnosus]
VIREDTSRIAELELAIQEYRQTISELKQRPVKTVVQEVIREDSSRIAELQLAIQEYRQTISELKQRPVKTVVQEVVRADTTRIDQLERSIQEYKRQISELISARDYGSSSTVRSSQEHINVNFHISCDENELKDENDLMVEQLRGQLIAMKQDIQQALEKYFVNLQ